MKRLSLFATATSCFVALACSAHARSVYDGSWVLAFVTQRGPCDPTYNFTVNVSNGIVTHPNLLSNASAPYRLGALTPLAPPPARLDQCRFFWISLGGKRSPAFT